MTPKFLDNQLCDGGYCDIRDTCVRYIGNIDLNAEDAYYPYITFNRRPLPFECPYYLDRDNGHYPQKQPNNPTT
ncbi:MAG: hypothetical protein HDR82_09550 [Bacteroides sp.]|nr:hypothetical protein [Bacteroides sp.]